MADCHKCEKHPAEIAYIEAQTTKEKAEAREAQAKALIAEINLERESEKRDEELAANKRHMVYVFDSEVGSTSVSKCIGQLNRWHRQDPECSIEFQINSPGGSIFDGFHLIDYISALRRQGHHVTMVGYGMVASMAGVLMQAADTRVLGANAFMLIHEGSLGAVGDFGNVEDRVKLMEQFHERILYLFEERAKPINSKTTARFIRNRWQRRDWWIPAQDCLSLGFVDEVR